MFFNFSRWNKLYIFFDVLKNKWKSINNICKKIVLFFEVQKSYFNGHVKDVGILLIEKKIFVNKYTFSLRQKWVGTNEYQKFVYVFILCKSLPVDCLHRYFEYTG